MTSNQIGGEYFSAIAASSNQSGEACECINRDNIAEGCGRNGGADFVRFLQIALGSACGLEYHLLLARNLGFLPLPGYTKLAMSVGEVKKILAGLIQKLRTEN